MVNLPFSSVSTTTHSSTTHSSHISVYTDEIKASEDSFSNFNMHCNDEETVAEEIEANLEEETNSNLESKSDKKIFENTYSLAVNKKLAHRKKLI
ncbi:1029_t:CDS:1, partial [Dentiscutata erythropus]